MIVGFKVGLTSQVTHAMHFGYLAYLYRIGAVLQLIGGDALMDKLALRKKKF